MEKYELTTSSIVSRVGKAGCAALQPILHALVESVLPWYAVVQSVKVQEG